MVDYTRLLEEAGVTFNLPAGIGTIVEISGCTNHAYKLLHLRDLLRDNQDVLTPEILEKTKAYVKVWDAL